MRKLFLSLLSLVCVIFLSSCAGGNSGVVTIHVYNWGEYIDTTILRDFTEETGIRIRYETFPSNEEMYAKLAGGGSNFDIVIPSDYMIERMINEGMLEKLNFDNIPNFRYIDSRFTNLPYDPYNEYSVPYKWGTVGILYNSTMVSEPVNSWNILWDERYAGQIFMYDSMRDSIGVSLKRLGFSLNTRDLSELEAAGAALIEQKPLVRAYVGDTVRDSMIGNEAALAVVYSGDAMFCMMNNPDLRFVVPYEGSNLWFDSIVIPKGSAHQAEAEKFINFLCRPDIALRNALYTGYSTVNLEAFNMLPDELRNNPAYWPPDDVFYRCEVFLDLGEFTREFDRVWIEVLAS